jgi:hypothetical protein
MQVNSRAVLTDVTVTDHQGNSVTGLSDKDFQLLDNGKPQQLASFDEHRQQPSQLIATASPDRFSNDYLQHPPAQVNVPALRHNDHPDCRSDVSVRADEADGEQSAACAAQQSQMRQDAAATSGAAYYNNNGLAQAAQHVLSTDGNFYTLSYSPNNLKNNNKWHRVEVKLLNDRYQLSYRHGYFDDGVNRQQPAKEMKIRTALQGGGNKLDVPSDLGEPILFSVRVVPRSAASLPGDTPPKKGETRYVVEYSVPAKDVYTANHNNNVGSAVLGTAAFIYDRNGELISRSALRFALDINEQVAKSNPDTKLNIVQPVNLPSGSNFLYLGVWDISTGRMGTVNAAVDVKTPKG